MVPLSAPTIRQLCRAARHLRPDEARLLLGRALHCACGEAAAALHCGARSPRKAALAAQHYARRAPHIASLHEAILRQLDYAQSETLRKIEEHFRPAPKPPVQAAAAPRGTGVAADLVFDLARFKDGFLAALRAEALETLAAAGSELFAEIGREDDAFSLPEPRAVEFLGRRENLLAEIPDDIHAAIEAELRAGLETGDSLRELSRRITQKFEAIDETRATTIASTETAAAYGYARQEAMGQAGITHRAWLTSHLPNVRAAHATAEDDERNQGVPLEEPFLVGGEKLMYPGDPAGSPENVINCHCVAIPLDDAPAP